MNDIEMMDMNDPQFGEKLLAALGVKKGETIQIVTPQFERTDGVVPSLPVDGWQWLRTLSKDALKQIGCGVWSEPDADGKVLMLFPHEWYSYIPAGYVIEDICGGTEAFVPGRTDCDYRYGCLAYGIRVSVSPTAIPTPAAKGE